jgi:hypothetical protein
VRNLDKLFLKSRRNGFYLVGPADKLSNIRLTKLYKPQNESNLEKEYRILHEHVQQWNHNYWSQQNLRYNFEKQKFINNFKLTHNQEPDTKEMTLFYKNFLDNSYQIHANYNKQWYKYNFMLIGKAFKVNFVRLLNYFK